MSLIPILLQGRVFVGGGGVGVGGRQVGSGDIKDLSVKSVHGR